MPQENRWYSLSGFSIMTEEVAMQVPSVCEFQNNHPAVFIPVKNLLDMFMALQQVQIFHIQANDFHGWRIERASKAGFAGCQSCALCRRWQISLARLKPASFISGRV
jgi:hypothetical protein